MACALGAGVGLRPAGPGVLRGVCGVLGGGGSPLGVFGAACAVRRLARWFGFGASVSVVSRPGGRVLVVWVFVR